MNKLNDFVDTLTDGRSTTDKLMRYLNDQGYSGSMTEMMYNFLLDNFPDLNSHSERFKTWISNPAIQRYFLTFDPVLNSYGELDTAFQPSGDFELEMDVLGTNLTDLQALISDETATTGIRIDPTTSDRIRVIVDGTFLNFNNTASVLLNGKLNTLKLTRTGTTFELFINGVSYGTGSTVKAISYKRLGRSYAANTRYFDGIIANVKLTDLVTAANSRIFPLNTLAGTENSTINTGSITINNIPAANRERFTFDEANNRWVANDGSPILEIG